MNPPAKVLIVDHSLSSLSNIYIKLLKENYNVEACNDASEIRPRINRFKPGVVILNKDLPGLDFENVCRELQTLQLPLILLVEAAPDVNIHDAQCIHCVIQKPVEVNKLSEVIDRLILSA